LTPPQPIRATAGDRTSRWATSLSLGCRF